MGIIFRQPDGSGAFAAPLCNVGITQCYFKEISSSGDNISQKSHHHTGVELHMVVRGSQVYQIRDKTIKLDAGRFLLIPPLVEHRAVKITDDILKYSITFSVEDKSIMWECISRLDSFVTGKTPKETAENIKRIRDEMKNKSYMYSTVVSGRIFECISGVLRLSGATATAKKSELETEDDSRLLLAKQYIKDNVTTSLTAADVALYCGMSAKQMFRIFMSGEGISPAEYVRRKRCKHVEKLLADTTLSLREISEIMNFNNEYYFNAYFKKHSGMTPGAYRRSLSK